MNASHVVRFSASAATGGHVTVTGGSERHCDGAAHMKIEQLHTLVMVFLHFSCPVAVHGEATRRGQTHAVSSALWSRQKQLKVCGLDGRPCTKTIHEQKPRCILKCILKNADIVTVL